MQIKNRYSHEVIYEAEGTLKEVLEKAIKSGTYLTNANLSDADLSHANLSYANLSYANLTRAKLSDANLTRAKLTDASLTYAKLTDARGMVKTMGVEGGNVYWKRFNSDMTNHNFQFKVGLNTLSKGEIFADDERIHCSYPGFHFGSRSWCAVNYPDRPFEARIRIPRGAKINEPWATDGKASADRIEILQVFKVATGEDVTKQYRTKNTLKRGNKNANQKSV